MAKQQLSKDEKYELQKEFTGRLFQDFDAYNKGGKGFKEDTAAQQDKNAFRLISSFYADKKLIELRGRNPKYDNAITDAVADAEKRIDAYGRSALMEVQYRGEQYAEARFKSKNAQPYSFDEFKTAYIQKQTGQQMGEKVFEEVKWTGKLEDYTPTFDATKKLLWEKYGISVPAGLKNPHVDEKGKIKGSIYSETVYSLKQMERQPNRVDVLEDPRLLVLMAALSGVAEIKTAEDLAKVSTRIREILPYSVGNAQYGGKGYSTEVVMKRGSGVCVDQAALLANVLAAYGLKGTIIELDVNTFAKKGEEVTPLVMLHAIVGTRLPSGSTRYLDPTNRIFFDNIEGIAEEMAAQQQIPPERGKWVGTEVVANAFIPKQVIEGYSPGTVSAIEKGLDDNWTGDMGAYARKFFEGLNRAKNLSGDTLKDLQEGYILPDNIGEVPQNWRKK
jgi:hypothetical protein